MLAILTHTLAAVVGAALYTVGARLWRWLHYRQETPAEMFADRLAGSSEGAGLIAVVCFWCNATLLASPLQNAMTMVCLRCGKNPNKPQQVQG